MKAKLFYILFLFAFAMHAQKGKPDYSKLPTNDAIKISLKGADLQNQIWQDSIVKNTELKLIGADAQNYSIVYYHFKTNYKKTLSEDEFYEGKIPESMLQFFRDLESNCKISFENAVIKHKENGKMFRISPLSLLIKP